MGSNRFNNNHSPLYTPRKKVERSFKNSTDECYYNLICGVLEQAVLDWQALDYGRYGVSRLNSEYIYRAEVQSFLQSEWFDELLSFALPQYTPQEIREVLDVPESERRKMRERKIHAKQNPSDSHGVKNAPRGV